MNEIEVLDIDETVSIGKNVTGIVTGICIRFGGYVTYEVVWWEGRQRKCQWLQSCEIKSQNMKFKKKIGFRQSVGDI